MHIPFWLAAVTVGGFAIVIVTLLVIILRLLPEFGADEPVAIEPTNPDT